MLKGQNCLITGATRGLGSHIASAFWKAGANLFLLSRSKEALDAFVDRFPKQSGQFIATMEADLNDPAVPKRIIKAVRLSFPVLDVMVNNAAMQGPIGALWANDWPAWQETVQVNLLSPVALCRLSVPWMEEDGKGKIINLSGGGATGPRAFFSAYATAKAGLVRFSETLAQETKSLRIDVNCIAPGAMHTTMVEEVLKAGAAASGDKEYGLALNVHEKGGALPQKAADLAVFLASSASDGITGKLISAIWDPWESFSERIEELQASDIYTLRRIIPKDRGMEWGER